MNLSESHIRKIIKEEIFYDFNEGYDYASDEREYHDKQEFEKDYGDEDTSAIGIRRIGVKDKNGNDICEGYVIKHNDILYVIKWSKSLKKYVARAESKSWRDLDWIKRVSNYIEIVDNIHFNQELFNRFKKYI